MKRSEAVKTIEGVLASFFHKRDSAWPILAEFVLEELEQKGLRPPLSGIVHIESDNESQLQLLRELARAGSWDLE
jgi:hypothetical protein